MPPLVLLILACASLCSAQERILGLVEIPALPTWEDLSSEQPSIVLRTAPSPDAASVAELRNFEQLEFREHGYEARSAVVYESQIIADAWWYRIRLADSKMVWLSGQNAGPVHWVDDLLTDRLTYFTAAWDRKLRLKAGDPASEFRVPINNREPSVTIADRTTIGGQQWLLVVITESSCEVTDPAVIASGWVPLYAADDSLNVWFYARGC